MPTEIENCVENGVNSFAFAYPCISPSMLTRWRSVQPKPFPFSEPGAEYFMLARSGIYRLARRWSLADCEVLFPSYFHGVELSALLAAGVIPRFFRVNRNMQVDLDDLANKITRKIAAVYLIHYLGFGDCVRQVQQLCNQARIPLIEDCALALFSRFEDKPLGSFGEAAVFCLYKTLAVPDGGVLVSGNGSGFGPASHRRPPAISTMARVTSSISQHCMLNGKMRVHAAIERLRMTGKRFAHNDVHVGTNEFDPTHLNIAASLATHWLIRAQSSEEIVKARRRNFLYLLTRLRSITTPIFNDLPSGVCPLFFPIRASDKLRVLERLAKRGVEAVNFWSYEHPLTAGQFPECSELRRTVVELPCHQDLTPAQLERIADTVHEVRQQLM